MVTISGNELSKIIKATIGKETPAPQETSIKKIDKWLTPVILSVGFILFVACILLIKDEAPALRELVIKRTRFIFPEEMSVKLQYDVVLAVCFIGFQVLYRFAHGLIHLLFTIDGRKATIYFVPLFPKPFNTFYNAWVSKKRRLLSLMAPTVILSALLVPLFWNLPTCVVGIMLLYHLLHCCTDIIYFFYLLKVLPANSLVYGAYYKPASMTGAQSISLSE